MMIHKKFDPSNGFNWCCNRIRRKTRGSSTSGKTKGETCQADYLKRHMAKCSRSYKHPLYGVWLNKTIELCNH